MEVSSIFELIGQATTVIVALAAAWWGFERWRHRDEHFPRIEFEVSANFVGVQGDRIIVEVVALVANKGVVPCRYKSLDFKLRALFSHDAPVRGDGSIRGQLEFPHLIAEGSFIPEHWDYSFIYPGIETVYNYVTDIPANVSFVRVQADLLYMRRGESHHAAKILRVPMDRLVGGPEVAAIT